MNRPAKASTRLLASRLADRKSKPGPRSRNGIPARQTSTRVPAYVPADIARKLLLNSAALLDDSSGPAGPVRTQRLIERLGYVQVDSIAVAARAHHHILMTRLDGYRPDTLRTLLEKKRSCFEHWTHDASVIPIAQWRAWQVRFAAMRERGPARTEWWRKQLGPRPKLIIDRVHDKIRSDGPLYTRDLERPARAAGESGGWWNWHPEKTAIEYLWRTGDVAICGRKEFEKRYDLTERVYPEACQLEPMDTQEHMRWACSRALARLVMATAREIADFFAAANVRDVRSWCEAACDRGDLVRVRIASLAPPGTPVDAYALPDWAERAAAAPDAPEHMRFLSPFDPVIRDRNRAHHRFGFQYRFEAFTPKAKRRYGYYVLPILFGDQIVGRTDVKFDRDSSTIWFRGPWWEDAAGSTATHRDAFDAAASHYAAQCGADWWDVTDAPFE